jgi:hypothetical protein
VANWAWRFAAYVYRLRPGLNVATERENHAGGWHARYVLRSPVILETLQ